MNARTFDIIDQVSREGINRGNWGLFHGPCESKGYLGTNESVELPEGDYLYIYLEPDSTLCFVKEVPDYRLTADEMNSVILVFKLD